MVSKLKVIALSLLLLAPFATHANIAVPWLATSTDAGYIQPNPVNGNNPFLKILSIGTSTFSNGINLVNGCFSVGGVCITGGGGSGTVTSIVAGTGLSGGTITTSGTIAVNTTQNITTLSNLTVAGFVQTTSSGVLSSAALTSSQVTTALGFTPFGGTNPLPIANGGTATTTGGNTNGVEYYNGSTLTNSTGFIFNGTSVGVASTSPWAELSINPNDITGPSFVVGSSTVTNLVVTNAGLVGIGIPNPAAQLEVSASTSNSSANAEVLRVSRTGGSSTVAMSNRTDFISFFDSANPTLTAGIAGIRPSAASNFLGALAFYVNEGSSASNVSSLTQVGIFNPVGDFGIGTSTFTSALSVQGNQYTSGSAFFGGAITATSTLQLSAFATPAGAFLAVDPSGFVITTTTPSGGGGGSVTGVTATYPILSSGGTAPVISTAFGTTTSNTFAGTQTFTNSPDFAVLGNGTVNSNATAGTIYSSGTSTASIGTGLAYSGTWGNFISGVSGTLTNSGLLSLQQLGGGTAQTGAITFSTSTQTLNGITYGDKITNSAGAFTFTPNNSGVLTVAGGGTGVATLTGCLTGNGTGAITGSGTCNTTNATVSSVSGSGGTTGLTLTGGPITTTGTLSLGGTLGIANGGTDDTAFTTNQLTYYNGTGLVSASSSAINNAGGYFGLGTTTPHALLDLATSTGIQEQLYDNSTGLPWNFVERAGSLFFATSSLTTFATSSNSVFSISPSATANATTTFSLTDFLLKQTSQTAFQIADAFGTIDALFNTASTTGSIFTVAATTSPSISAPIKLFDVDQYGHLTASSTGPTMPTVTCVPSGGTISSNSNDDIGTITGGTLSTSCTVTFARAYAVAPIVQSTGSNIFTGVTAESTTQFTVSMIATTGDVINYWVVQP